VTVFADERDFQPHLFIVFSSGSNFLSTLAIIPGVFIGLTVLAFNILGDSLRDVV